MRDYDQLEKHEISCRECLLCKVKCPSCPQYLLLDEVSEHKCLLPPAADLENPIDLPALLIERDRLAAIQLQGINDDPDMEHQSYCLRV